MRQKPVKSNPGKWTFLIALLTAVGGIALSLFAHSRIVSAEKVAAQLTADALRSHTEQELALFAEALESTSLLLTFEAANYNQAIINEFIQKGMPLQHAVLGTFGLAQRIDQQTRNQTEQLHQRQPELGYRVVHKGINDTWFPAKPQPYYYPLFFQNRTNALNVPTGFDLSSIHSAYQVIINAERTRKTTVDPTPTFFSPPNDPAYWVFAPFADPYDTSAATIGGVAVAVLHPSKLLDKVATLSAPSSQLKLVPAQSPPSADVQMADHAWIIRQPIHAIGTDWLFECSLPIASVDRRSTMALFFGLSVTALMTGLILLLAGRTRRIEAEVLVRTEELRIANRQLEQNILERAQLEEEMNELSAREQRRIGRDLHDSLGQKLTGAVFLSRSLLNWFEKFGAWSMEHGGRQKLANRNQESEVRGQKSATSDIPHSTSRNSPTPDILHSTVDTQLSHAQTLNETLKDTVSQVRNMARGLASVTLNDESLEESLHQLTEEMSSLYDIPCALIQTGLLPPLDRKTKEQLYFIAREAVNNAARHANACRITVELIGNPDGWKLLIKDDGTGLPETQKSEGMGLRIMRHRAARIGARFLINSLPGQGTAIEVISDQ